MAPRWDRESPRRRLGWVGSALILVLALARSVSGQSTPKVPEFTGEHVYAVDVPDRFAPLREDIGRLERTSNLSYYVVVLRTTGPGRGATRSYLETLVEDWKAQAKRKNLKFDTGRSIVIVLAIDKHEIIVLGGEDLQERFGFRDPYIERDLLQPHFYPYARAGDYQQGLRILVGQIDRWISERDTALARRRQEGAARDARLKTDAASTIAGARRQLDEARGELEARKKAGLDVKALETTVRKASEALDTAGRRLDASAGEALQLAQQSERDLGGVVEQLRRYSAMQADLDDRLQDASARSDEVLKAVEQAGRQGLPTGPVQHELEEANKILEEAGKAIKSDPDRAETLLTRADRMFANALEHARSLGTLRAQAETQRKALAALEQSASSQLQKARQGGVEMGQLEGAWKVALARLESARKAAGIDDRHALAEFQSAEESLSRLERQARDQLARRRLWSRTIPLSFLAFLLLAALSVLGYLWYRKRHLMRAFDEQFKGFRERAVSLMDQLDGLRHRHKSLLTTDPDFVRPLSGSSLALYEGVEGDLNVLWERWLKIMEAWEKAQRLSRSGSALAVAETKEAKKLIDEAGNFDELIAKIDSCKQRLDRLGQGHETARADLKAGRDELATLKTSLDEVAAAGLPLEPYQAEVRTVEGLFDESEGLIEADPIGAAEVVARSRKALGASVARVGQVLARVVESREVSAAIDAVAATASKWRADGLKLTERLADPDPTLEQARRQLSAAGSALKQGDPVAAGQRIVQASSATDHAREAVERHVEARDSSRKDLPARREAARRLQESFGPAASVDDSLRKSFDPASWSDVAGHLDEARGLAQSIASRIAEAESDSDDSVQNYFKAASALDRAASEQSKAEALLKALTERQKSLVRDSERAREVARGLDNEFRQVEAFFGQNRKAIGAEARTTFEHVAQWREDVSARMSAALPNWPEVLRRLDSVRNGLKVAMRQGQEDVEGYRQVVEKLDLVAAKARSVGSLLEGENKDRPPANQRYRAAIAALAPLQTGNGLPDLEWDRLLARLNEIEGDLDRARALAQEDISLANGAIAEIAEADRSIRSARAYYTSGVTVDVTEAEARLARARGALASQAYPEAIEFAESAEQAAHEAYQAAAHEARLRDLRRERSRVSSNADAAVLIAAAQAAAENAGRWLRTSGSASPSGGRSDSSVSTGGGDQGSWGTSNQGDWTSGADQGSW